MITAMVTAALVAMCIVSKAPISDNWYEYDKQRKLKEEKQLDY